MIAAIGVVLSVGHRQSEHRAADRQNHKSFGRAETVHLPHPPLLLRGAIEVKGKGKVEAWVLRL